MHAGRVRTNVPRALRTLRHRRRWRQEDLGRRAGLSRDVVHRAEAGELRGITVGSLGRLTEALDAQLVVEIRWRGAELDRLVDADHARIVSAGAQRLERSGWIVRTEVSFNHFGDRGRCDLVAWHAGTRTLVIVEVKSRIGDLQETLGRLDVKARLGSVIADQLAWDAHPPLSRRSSSTSRPPFVACCVSTRHSSGASGSAVGLHSPGCDDRTRPLE
jgi:transcriptional regulator with XRE-family HTH domain